MPAASPHGKAERHLRSVDARLARLIDEHGRCTIRPADNLFDALMRIVISQQIATRAAEAISARVDAAFPRGLTPTAIRRASDEKLRGCGLSGPKQRAMRAIAEAFSGRALSADRLRDLPDEEVAARLLPIKGVGPWTVDMVLMFVLARPDVLPVGDYGLKLAIRDLYALPDVPAADQMLEIAAPWRPYRTVASWYLWRVRDT